MLMGKRYIWVLLSMVITGFFLPCYGQSSSNFQFKSWSISNGGGVVNSSNFHMNESVMGGLAVGESSSGSFVLNGGMIVTPVDDLNLYQMDVIPKLYSLQQNYPNPFNPQTSIRYGLPKGSEVTIRIFNTLGKEVRTLEQGYQQAGHYQVKWDGKDNRGQQISSGIYYYQIFADGFMDVKKMMLLR